jgi:hypothetical protein
MGLYEDLLRLFAFQVPEAVEEFESRFTASIQIKRAAMQMLAHKMKWLSMNRGNAKSALGRSGWISALVWLHLDRFDRWS